MNVLQYPNSSSLKCPNSDQELKCTNPTQTCSNSNSAHGEPGPDQDLKGLLNGEHDSNRYDDSQCPEKPKSDQNMQLNVFKRDNNRKFWVNMSEEIIQTNQLPQRPGSPEDHLQVNDYTLPPRKNRGKPPERYVLEDGTSINIKYPMANYTSTKNLNQPLKNFSEKLVSLDVPKTVEEALKDPKWIHAMDLEMKALNKNGTWSLIELPKGKKSVGCKWVYTIKFSANGEVERYKARLVAKEFTQTYGIDFQETFSPVAKLNTIRVLLSLAANLDWLLHQFDVKNVFLHGDLKEEIYMDPPPGYINSDSRQVVCRLHKALYGLKQSPRAWFGRFRNAMKNYDFEQSDSDHTLFFKRQQEKLTVLIIYVDDMIITGNDKDEIKRLEERLSTEFEMKSLGRLKYFLGIEVMRSERGITLSQRKYILDLLAEVRMLNCKPADTPVIQNLKLEENAEQAPTNKERYQRLVGKLIYLSHTRPDIAYAIGLVSQFMHNPSEEHMEAVTRIIIYLKGTPGKGIQFLKNGHLDIMGYTDADWAGKISDRRSTSGYFTFIGGNLVTWRSKKQKTVALSSAESELKGAVKGVCELLWLRKLMNELGFPPTKEMDLFCDNKAAIDISHNPVQHDRTKHVGVNRHFLHENIEAKIILMSYVQSERQLANILTKATSSKMFHDTLSKLAMTDPYIPT
jgi:Reverse transcriptase (RNA-dependent DNA polymerase)